MSSALVFLCATAVTSASGFYEPVDNVKARPFYKSPPSHVSEYEYQPHPEYTAEELFKPVYEQSEHLPSPAYKPVEHVPAPAYKVPAYKVPEDVVPPAVYKQEPSHPGYHHGQASSFQNVAYKVTQQAYREVEHKPHNSPLYS